MVNHSKKIGEALNIIRKYYAAVNVQRTDNEDVVYLFDYTSNKKTVGSEKIAKALEKALKQQDFPKDIYYSEGMLSAIKETVKEVEPEVIVEEQIEAEEITEIEQPKKRGRKKQTETDIDAES